MSDVAVDDFGFEAAPAWWLGFVVPKRHARRSVTRNLLRRQLREAFGAHVARLPPGLWVLRLRGAFDLRLYPSAASDALRRAARSELEAIFDVVRASKPMPVPPSR
jgi:ribonuclease P protein component